MKTKLLVAFLTAALLFGGRLSARPANPGPETPADPATPKYAIGMFHFNLQYLAGDYKIERRIIRESLLPVLQFFDQHPEYKSDIEIQGYAIEVLAQEHPDVLALLKKLVKRRQIELVIAHYSDQLFIGYPALDLQKSIEISDQVLAENGLERSRVFFGQEIQWSPGLAYALKGKYDVVVTSSDPNSWYNGETLPLVNVRYGDDSIEALIGGGLKKLKGMDWDIAFLDDGEDFNTTDYNSNFFPVPAQAQEHIDRFKQLLDEGYKFVTITELTKKIKADPGYTLPEYPFIPEGTWHMKVCGPFMWMGRQRSGVETDGITRALSYQARGELLMTEKLLDYAAGLGMDVSALRKLLLEAWKDLLLSEVSDSSGWDPWLVEVQYTDNEVANMRMLLKKILEALAQLLNSAPPGKAPGAAQTPNALTAGTRGAGVPASAASAAPLLVNTFTGLVTPDTAVSAPDDTPSALPVNFSVRAASYTVKTVRLSDSLYRMDIECARPADGAVEITFGTGADGLEYSASCGERTKVFIPTTYKNDPAFALTNGFIYLGNGYSLIKDCTVEHLAATWKTKTRALVFREELREGNMHMHMRFYIVKGTAEDGLGFGNRLNTWPSYYVRFNNGKADFSKVTP